MNMNMAIDKRMMRTEQVLLTARDPIAVMFMPGCYEQVVNERASRLFGESPFVARSLGDLRRFLTARKKRQSRLYDLCACTKAAGILALEPEHCAFDAALSQLRATSPPDWVKTIGFFRLRQFRRRRQYKIFLVHSTLFGNDASHLVSRLVELDGLALEIETLEDKAGFPHRLQVTVKQGSKEWSNPFTYEVKDASKVYRDFAQALLETARSFKFDSERKKAENFLCERIADIARGYEPVFAWVHSFFAEKKNARAQIGKALQRTFDALAAEGLKQHILGRIAGEHIFARWAFSIRELEAIDAVRAERRPLSRRGYRLSEYETNMKKFTQSLPELERMSGGMCVAIVDGQLVDMDKDELTLCERVTRKFKGRPVLIKPVERKSDVTRVRRTLRLSDFAVYQEKTKVDPQVGESMITNYDEW